jgi:CheY-like chemotaxis protein
VPSAQAARVRRSRGGEHGREALERLAARPFDVVLLDIMMPEMDGYEVLERLKADETWRPYR